MSPIRIPDGALLQNRFQSISFRVFDVDVAASSQGTNLDVEKVDIAVRQAMALWSAEAPVTFEPARPVDEPLLRIRFVRNGRVNADVGTTSGHIDRTPAGPFGTASIEIDCDHHLFVDRFQEPPRPPLGRARNDLIAAIGHEVGHALGLDHPPKDPVTGKETEPALMSESLASLQRQLLPFDIREVQRRHGAIRLAQTIRADLQATAQLIDASPGVELQRGVFGLVLFGPMPSRAVLDLLIPARRQRVNSLRLKFTIFTKNLVVNRIETFDGIVPLQAFALSARNAGDEGLAGRLFDVRLGFLRRHSMTNDMLVRLELLFTNREGEPLSEFGVLHLEDAGVETLPWGLEGAIDAIAPAQRSTSEF